MSFSSHRLSLLGTRPVVFPRIPHQLDHNAIKGEAKRVLAAISTECKLGWVWKCDQGFLELRRFPSSATVSCYCLNSSRSLWQSRQPTQNPSAEPHRNELSSILDKILDLANSICDTHCAFRGNLTVFMCDKRNTEQILHEANRENNIKSPVPLVSLTTRHWLSPESSTHKF